MPDDHRNVARQLGRDSLQGGRLEVGEEVDLLDLQVGRLDQASSSGEGRGQVSPRRSDSGLFYAATGVLDSPRDRDIPGLGGPDHPDQVFPRRHVQGLVSPGLQIVQDSGLSSHSARAHGVVQNDGEGGGIVELAATAQEEPRAGRHQEEDGGTPEEKQDELPDADPAGVLLLGPPKVAKGREDDATCALSVEEVQKDGDRHRSGSQ